MWGLVSISFLPIKAPFYVLSWSKIREFSHDANHSKVNCFLLPDSIPGPIVEFISWAHDQTKIITYLNKMVCTFHSWRNYIWHTWILHNLNEYKIKHPFHRDFNSQSHFYKKNFISNNSKIKSVVLCKAEVPSVYILHCYLASSLMPPVE